MGPRAGLDGRKISSPPGYNPGPSSPYSVAIPTELPGPQRLDVPGVICGLVVRVSGHRHRGPGFDPRRYQIF